MNFLTGHFKLIILIISLLLLLEVILVFFIFAPRFNNYNISRAKYVEVCGEKNPDCPVAGLPFQNPSLSTEQRVTDLLARMTNTEKIGQMALIEKNSIHDLNDIARYGLGALMSGSGGKPDDNTGAGWLRMVENFTGYSRKTRLAIPILYGVDAAHGHSNVIGATIFPHAIGLGASQDPELVREVARATAEEAAATGVYWVFSPNLDIARDTRWGRTYETFGSDPELTGILGQAYTEGLQSFRWDGMAMAATAKHFVGIGSSEWGSSINKDFFIDQGNSNISEDRLRRIHFAPFKQAVDAGVKSVMVGLNKWNGEKVSFNKHLITDILKEENKFPGFVVSDWYGVYEKEHNKYRALAAAVNAGVDMVMLPFDYKTFSVSMHRALANGDVSQARFDEAAGRILKVKFEIGLFDKAGNNTSYLENIGKEAHRELARSAVRKSLVLLKNNNAVPISKNIPEILVAGSAADNIGRQSGGWTVEWQGIDGNWIPGTTVLQGIRNMASPGTEVEYDLEGDFGGRKDVAELGIAVVSESPYAEGWGDKEDPRLSAQDLKAIHNLENYCKKIIVVIISGRPLDIKEYAADWDAIIAAWLPGSEGQGVADVLFGDYDFTGTLPVNWEL